MTVDVLLVSDLHVGRKTATYGVKVFRHRMKQLVKQVAKIAKDSRGLIIGLLGDIVDGEEVYRGHGYEVDLTADAMVDEATYRLAGLYDKMSELYKSVSFCCVYGNHGRANRAGSTSANWDLMVYRRLEDQIGRDNVLVSNRWWVSRRIGEMKFFMCHGDNVKMYHQIPYYGIVQRALRMSTYDYHDVICMGHFHTVFYLNYNGVRIYGNGTMLTGDDYSLKMGLIPTNEFWLLGISEKRKKILWQIPVSVCDLE